MTEEEYAQDVRNAANSLNNAIKNAACNGLTITVDQLTIEKFDIGAVPFLAVAVYRKL